MFPPSAPGGWSHLDLSALSGIAGSISIACWVVVFSPQILENFRRQSVEGLSVTFIIVWLLGDIFNIIGAILQGVLPTMIILAVYYTLADIVLLLQVWYYGGLSFGGSGNQSNKVDDDEDEDEHDRGYERRQENQENQDQERRPLLRENDNNQNQFRNRTDSSRERLGSLAALRQHLLEDGAHLSPATPLHDAPKPKRKNLSSSIPDLKDLSTTQTFVFNTICVLLVCGAGILGWWLSSQATTLSKSPNNHEGRGNGGKGDHHHDNSNNDNQNHETLQFDTWGQIFGYLCAILYLGSRIPQILLNYRRKSTEGVSLLFFLFACIGNLTYDLSIFAYDPTPLCSTKGNQHHQHHRNHCQPGESLDLYMRYIAVNASWILGSLGTLALDLTIFAQFFLYRKDETRRGSDGESETD